MTLQPPDGDRAAGAGSRAAREVWVLRHAKAAADSPDGQDHSRPLTKRGRAQVERTARFLGRLRGEGVAVPRLVLSSSAVRALETAQRALPGLGDDVTLEVEDDLYEVEADEIVERLRQVTDGVPSVMVVGHNPAFAELVQLLVSQDDDRGRNLSSFPTCALAQIGLPCATWGELVARSGHLTRLFVPET